MNMEEAQSSILSNVVVISAIATTGLAAALSYALLSKSSNGEDVPASTAVSCDNSISESEIDKEIYPGGHITVYYGSQTGTAETFAMDLQREGESHGFKVRVVDLEDAGEESELQSELLNELYRDEKGQSRAIFLMATYGEGEPTDNAQTFTTLIQRVSGVKGLPSTSTSESKSDDETERDAEYLAALDYAVFGLGNKQYEHYNAMGKLTDEALGEMGAKRIIKLGMGNDDEDLEADFENWRENCIWPALAKAYIDSSIKSTTTTTTTTTMEIERQLPKCPHVVQYVDDDPMTADAFASVPEQDMHNSTKHYFTATDCPITAVRELRSQEDPGSTIHLEIDISKAPFHYQTADNLAVLPKNDASLVHSLSDALQYNLDDVFLLKSSDDDDTATTKLFPTPCTVRDCLSNYVDITSAPRRSELKLLANFASDPLDRDALLRMASKEGKSEYKAKVLDANIGLVDIVTRLCKSLKIPLEYLIQICPHLQPRYYTIASSSSVHPKSVHLTVSVLEKKRKDGTMFKGVCTNYLAKAGSVRVFCRDSTFRLPKDPSKPIIMIGPGTGYAPMRALLQERSYMNHTLHLPVGPNILYFGCKKESLDYIYQDEIQSNQDIDLLRVAFSRDQTKKVYVQHLLEQDATQMWDYIHNKGAHVYICGGIKMGHDVCSTLKNIFQTTVGSGVTNEAEAKKYLDTLHAEGRLVQELWA